jgi:hypothetical protein
VSNPRLDRAAETVTARRTQPELAALEPLEQHLIKLLADIAPDLDRPAVGAGWLILAEAFVAAVAQASGQFSAEVLVNVAQLAGQRLYSGSTARLETPCPVVRDSGRPCRFTATGPSAEYVDALMQTHYATYHPGETWPPPVPDWCAGPKLDEVRRAAQERLDEQDAQCACGAPAAMEVGYRGESATVRQCVRCATVDPRSPFASRSLAGTRMLPPEAQGPHSINDVRRAVGLPEIDEDFARERVRPGPNYPRDLDGALAALRAEAEGTASYTLSPEAKPGIGLPEKCERCHAHPASVASSAGPICLLCWRQLFPDANPGVSVVVNAQGALEVREVDDPDGERPTPRSVREGRHSLNDLRRAYGLDEIGLPDDEPMPEGLLDALIKSTWAEAEEAAALVVEHSDRFESGGEQS